MRCGRRRVSAAPVLVAVEALPLGFGSRGAGVRRVALAGAIARGCG